MPWGQFLPLFDFVTSRVQSSMTSAGCLLSSHHVSGLNFSCLGIYFMVLSAVLNLLASVSQSHWILRWSNMFLDVVPQRSFHLDFNLPAHPPLYRLCLFQYFILEYFTSGRQVLSSIFFVSILDLVISGGGVQPSWGPTMLEDKKDEQHYSFSTRTHLPTSHVDA